MRTIYAWLLDIIWTIYSINYIARKNAATAYQGKYKIMFATYLSDTDSTWMQERRHKRHIELATRTSCPIADSGRVFKSNCSFAF